MAGHLEMIDNKAQAQHMNNACLGHELSKQIIMCPQVKYDQCEGIDHSVYDNIEPKVVSFKVKDGG